MRPKKEKKSITIDSDIVESVTRMAEEDNRSFSQYINGVLRQWIVTIERQKKDPERMPGQGMTKRADSWKKGTFERESLDEKRRS